LVDKCPDLVDISRPLWTIGTLAATGRYPASTGTSPVIRHSYAVSTPDIDRSWRVIRTESARLAEAANGVLVHTVHTPTGDDDG